MVDEDETRTRISGRAAGDRGAYLLVVRDDSSFIHHLPRSGVVVIGRAPEAELRVDHASVSRRHAEIRITDGAISIADLGSHNGTRVNGDLITHPRALASGDVAMVGDVVCVVHTAQPSPPGHTTYPEAGWRRRLAEELARAVSFRRTLGILAVSAPQLALATLAPALRLIDVAGTMEAGELMLLVPDADRAEVRATAARVLALAPAARVGLAMCPDDACDVDAILLVARAAARRAAVGAIGEPGEAEVRIELGSRHVVVAEPAMIKVFALLERLAASALPVLILGESGVGKENAAYAVHHWSRRTGPFVAVNCAALPETLVESELFGHDKGAFTGAAAAKAGLFEAAAGGTVFLDEVGELALSVQAKLLRLLETKRVTRIGETRERDLDVRIVAATNRIIDDEVAAGRFRKDLLFRLSGATVVIPPLRDRRAEIPILARELLAEACARAGRPRMTIRPAAMQLLLTHAWPGNIRQLVNAMEFVAATAPDDDLEAGDLPQLGEPAEVPPEAPAAAINPTSPFRPIADELRELERRRMAEALAAAGGVKTRAALLIGMPLRTFTLKLKQYKL